MEYVVHNSMPELFLDLMGIMPYESLQREGRVGYLKPIMKRYFEKVSRGQWTKDYSEWYKDTKMVDSSPKEVVSDLEYVYSSLKKPRRATTGSAGYDICTPFDVTIESGDKVKIPTGWKVYMPSNEVLIGSTRSSDGVKKNIRVANVFPVIDSDYVDNKDNEGMIYIVLKNEDSEPRTYNEGDAIAQLIFIEYKITDDDDTTETRKGGIGSTTK